MDIKKTIKDTVFFLQRNPVSKLLFTREMTKRSKLSLTDIVPLSKHINMFSPFTSEIHPSNDWYGHASIFKKFLGLPSSYQFKSLIEHGVYLSKQVDDIDIESNLPSMMTYCNYRAEVLKKYRSHIFSIGPFIHYAESYLSAEETRKEKKRLGKTLLLFPSHSSFLVEFKYDIDSLCKKVKQMGKNFDSIRVCLYWADVIFQRQDIYRKYGFECVTAGHILDPLFLSRLKSIIETADVTVSNIAGTHVGYSIFYNKPHVILFQKPGLSTAECWKQKIEEFWQSKPFNEVLKEFSKPVFKITPKQRKLVEIYWGTNLLKTKKELLGIVKKTEDIYRKTKQ